MEMTMLLTKLGHSCVRLEKGGPVLVIDPGIFTEPEALDGASAVLITHEHTDHLDGDRLRAAAAANPRLEVWTNESVAAQLSDLGPRVHLVEDGSSFSAAGFDVAVIGEFHAIIHPDIPKVRNVCFLVDGDVFHPGDSLTLPGSDVRTLLLPIHAPWLKLSEAIEFARSVRPGRVIAIHDGMLNDRGLGLTDRLLGMLVGTAGSAGSAAPEYRRLASHESIELG
jgi:L-ascorbate metabolism protein UlaG (beta-lactamase superfamily)